MRPQTPLFVTVAVFALIGFGGQADAVAAMGQIGFFAAVPAWLASLVVASTRGPETAMRRAPALVPAARSNAPGAG